jgi:site-specific DNA-methyltransferase (adenine-specific)
MEKHFANDAIMRNTGGYILQINGSLYRQLPDDLKVLFVKVPNCGKEEVLALFPERKTTWISPEHANNRSGEFLGDLQHPGQQGFNDSGSAARFFYSAKASRQDRDEGLDDFASETDKRKTPMAGRGQGGLKCKICGKWKNSGSPCVCPEPDFEKQDFKRPEQRNTHPTVKNTSLMRYLCKLITPPNGLILDPFMGSGSTGKAAVLEGFRYIGIDESEEYCEIARKRVAFVEKQRT